MQACGPERSSSWRPRGVAWRRSQHHLGVALPVLFLGAAPRAYAGAGLISGGRDSCLGFAGTKVRVGGRGASRARRDRDVASRRLAELDAGTKQGTLADVPSQAGALGANGPARRVARGMDHSAVGPLLRRASRKQPPPDARRGEAPVNTEG